MTNAVIAEPHDYSAAEKQSILKAAELAKLNVLQLIGESSVCPSVWLDEPSASMVTTVLVMLGSKQPKLPL